MLSKYIEDSQDYILLSCDDLKAVNGGTFDEGYAIGHELGVQVRKLWDNIMFFL